MRRHPATEWLTEACGTYPVVERAVLLVQKVPVGLFERLLDVCYDLHHGLTLLNHHGHLCQHANKLREHLCNLYTAPRTPFKKLPVGDVHKWSRIYGDDAAAYKFQVAFMGKHNNIRHRGSRTRCTCPGFSTSSTSTPRLGTGRQVSSHRRAISALLAWIMTFIALACSASKRLISCRHCKIQRPLFEHNVCFWACEVCTGYPGTISHQGSAIVETQSLHSCDKSVGSSPASMQTV